MRGLICYITFFSLNAFSQPGKYDSIPRVLVTEPVAIVDTMPIYLPAASGVYAAYSLPLSYYGNFTSSALTFPSYNYQFDPAQFVYTWTIVEPPCGDSFHENGQISSRIECVDSVKHGKAVFWDDSGHKTSERTYADGHSIKTKAYDENGRISYVYHYDYAGEYHGICIDYDYEINTKTEEHYEHGVVKNKREFYEGWLSSTSDYQNGELIEENYFNASGACVRHISYNGGGDKREEKNYNDAGQLILHEWHSERNDSGFYKVWSAYGELTAEGYYRNRVPVGTWLKSTHPTTKAKTFSFYDDSGRLLRMTEVVDSRLTYELIYENGQEISTTRWNEQGDSIYFQGKKPGADVYVTKRWENGVLLDHHAIYWPGYGYQKTFYENGFYTLNDTVYSMIVDRNNRSWPHVCYVIYKGDTMREDYVYNKAGDLSKAPEIIASNHYAYDNVTEAWVKNGTWKTYRGNQLLSVQNYVMGIRKGWELNCVSVYNSNDNSSEGYYENGKQGEWIFYSINGGWMVMTFVNSVLHGECRVYNSHGTLKRSIHYLNGVENGSYQEYYASGTLEFEGSYLNGKQHGWWKYYDNMGNLVREGEMENGTAIKTWISYNTWTGDRTRTRYKDGKPVS